MRCSDYDSDGSHDLIGVFHTSLTQLQAAPVSDKGSHNAVVGIDSRFPREKVKQTEYGELPTLNFLFLPG